MRINFRLSLFAFSFVFVTGCATESQIINEGGIFGVYYLNLNPAI